MTEQNSWFLAAKDMLDTCRLGWLSMRIGKGRPQGVKVEEMTPEGLKIRCYRGKESFFPLVVAHGLTRQGYDDHRLCSFSRVLAKVGFLVYTPNLDGLRKLTLDAADLKRLEEAVKIACSSQPGFASVGLMGFSFGGSYCLLTSGYPKVREKIKFIVAGGSYRSLKDLVGHTIAGANIDPYGVLALQWESRGELGLDLEQIAVFENLMENYCRIEGVFAPEEKKLAEKLLDKESLSLLQSRWDELLPSMSCLDLTDNVLLRQIQAPVFLFHSKEDKVIPPSETLALAADLHDMGKEIYCSLGSNRGHIDYNNGNMLSLGELFYRVMKLRRGHV